MSSGGSSSTQTTSLDPTMAGILSSFGTAAQSAMQQPYQQYNGPRVANLSPLQQQSMQGYSQLLANPAWGQAQGTYSDLQSGDMNPFLKQQSDTVIHDATNAYDQATNGTRSSYNTPGNFNSSRMNLAQDKNDENFARGLSSGLGSINAQAYDAMQNRRLQGAQGSQSLAGSYGTALQGGAQAGNMQRGFDQSVIDTLYNDWQGANNYPWDQLQKGAGIFGQLQGGAPRTTTTQGPGADPVAQGLGAWALGSSMSSGKK